MNNQNAYFVLYDKQDRPYRMFDNIQELCDVLGYKSVATAYQTFSRFIRINNPQLYAYENEDGTTTYSQLVFYYQPRGNNPRWNKGKYRGFSLYKFWDKGGKNK